VIVTGDWVLPVSQPSIRNGAVAVRGHTIADVGSLAEVTGRHPTLTVSYHPGCVIIPGLVNAHAHLSLTALGGLVPSMRFPEWLARIASVSRRLDADDLAASSAFGALLCLRTGATVVGDICYGPEALAAAGDTGVGGVFYWEVLGLRGRDLERALEEHEFPADDSACRTGRLRCGISPHAPYTSGPELLRASHRVAREHGVGYMVHLAESAEEEQLLASGDGPLAPVAARLATGFDAPGCGSVRYANDLGILEDTVAVHCVRVTEEEAGLLAEHARGVVLCPRSNRYLKNGAPPVARLRAAGAQLAVGTDSVASNEGIDLFAEARALRTIDPGLSAARLLTMLTLEGAGVLGIDELLGSLDAGKQADLAVVATGAAEHPVEHLIETGSPDQVRAVMSAGMWRILDGRPCRPGGGIEQAAARVTAKAAHVLGGAAGSAAT
jgi:cytosine/adenosine deaminase-related metal-dependent hydrolase